MERFDVDRLGVANYQVRQLLDFNNMDEISYNNITSVISVLEDSKKEILELRKIIGEMSV